MNKRKRVRAIIFIGRKLVSMYREFGERTFYTFPGGGIEGEETEEECITREVFEEFGLFVKPTKKVYVYENEKSIEHFYICTLLSGEFGTGKGEEFSKDNKNGVYKPVLLNIDEISFLPLMPPEIASLFLKDFEANGEDLRDEVKFINANLH